MGVSLLPLLNNYKVTRPRPRPPGPAAPDRRLLAAQELLMAYPAALFADPVRGAAAWGVHLAAEFFVCEIPIFTDEMTLAEYEELSEIRAMSAPMRDFLDVEPNQCRNQAAIRWLGEVCPIGCVRRCVVLCFVFFVCCGAFVLRKHIMF